MKNCSSHIRPKIRFPLMLIIFTMLCVFAEVMRYAFGGSNV
jgi:hypothetical protein